MSRSQRRLVHPRPQTADGGFPIAPARATSTTRSSACRRWSPSASTSVEHGDRRYLRALRRRRRSRLRPPGLAGRLLGMIAQAPLKAETRAPLRCLARHPAGRSSTGSKAIAHPMAATTRRAAPHTGPPMPRFSHLAPMRTSTPRRRNPSGWRTRSTLCARAMALRQLPRPSARDDAGHRGSRRDLRHSTPDCPLISGVAAGAATRGRVSSRPPTPIPDLLSTATALHALTSLHAPIDGIREPCSTSSTRSGPIGAASRQLGRRRPGLRVHLLRPARAGPSRGVTRRFRDGCGSSSGGGAARGRANRRRLLGRRAVEQRAVDRHGARRARSLRSGAAAPSAHDLALVTAGSRGCFRTRTRTAAGATPTAARSNISTTALAWAALAFAEPQAAAANAVARAETWLAARAGGIDPPTLAERSSRGTAGTAPSRSRS